MFSRSLTRAISEAVSNHWNYNHWNYNRAPQWQCHCGTWNYNHLQQCRSCAVMAPTKAGKPKNPRAKAKAAAKIKPVIKVEAEEQNMPEPPKPPPTFVPKPWPKAERETFAAEVAKWDEDTLLESRAIQRTTNNKPPRNQMEADEKERSRGMQEVISNEIFSRKEPQGKLASMNQFMRIRSDQ